MRKLLSLMFAGLLAATLGACSEQPTQVQGSGTDAAADHSDNAAPRSEGTFTSTTWANGHLWEFKRVQPVFNQGKGNDKFVFVTPSADIAQRPFYVIGWKAGNDGKQSTLFFGGNGHDHVTTAPPNSQGAFKATVQLFVVVAAEGVGDDVGTTDAVNFFTGEDIDLAYAADLDDDGMLEDFTNVERVKKAHDQGLIKVMTTFEETVLTMRDIEG